ncbi:MMS22 (YLR320W) [Zygosaccharomyces parabailii]|uniref:BN860_07888g1_1 n=1 Tax=Zygosaccharomyces bailii (strain CLIB 213 / ATCC 58445 / CBS 680 / BCRC 21525 / NBRC 1098 / NCYC 1416 / NRRL Y-2227) TaxID=1333698 RepID=A0A8J2WUM9_ZYGB2|nr:MMS22 (YLR320W) [Zygosaccharomyces parabailii]CDF87504.1 BN860_07888g1_1 [Zygosaccharomyces bailii CLIB 213]
MLVDETSWIVVPDSEEEGTLLFNPHDAENTSTSPEPGVLSVARGDWGMNKDVAISEGYQRSLRKRKAIQRMPYSLDRIKHRQLLEGYDMSGFESISEELKLPSPPRCVIEGTTKSCRHDVNEYLEAERDDESDRTSTSEEDIVKFRGKVVNMKTGFRGVLPRVAWEKALRQRDSTVNTPKRRRPSTNHKGIAKKKTTTRGKTINQDDALLGDLIVSEEEDQEAHIQLHEKPGEDFLQEMELINEHYHEKYDNQYLSENETSNERWTNYVFKLDQKDLEGISINAENDMAYSDEYSDFDSDLLEIGALENDRNAIDTMLSKGKQESRNMSSSLRGANVANGTSNVNKCATKSKIIHQRRCIRNCRKEKQGHLPASHQPPSKLTRNYAQTAAIKTRRQRERSKDFKSKKPEWPSMKIEPFKNTRRANTFSTVIEAPSNKYVVPKHSLSRTDNSESIECITDEDEYCHKISLDALEALTSGKNVKPPDTIVINLSNKHYTLSKFLQNETPLTLVKIFDHIIENGITDQELLQVSESLTLFLLHLNHLGISEVISDFHKKFRSKVNSLREKAKPIHFYQIAVCQLMLLEIAHYSDISSFAMMEIKSNIVNHVVSFFKLLAFCYEAVADCDMAYLYDGCDILSKVVLVLNMKNELWEKLREHTFQAEVCLLLVDTFPIEHSEWEILKLDQHYIALTQAFAFIEYCKKKLHWKYENHLLFPFDKIFKKRRYEDFNEEELSTAKNRVLGPRQVLARTTMFDKYLGLLQDTPLTNSVIERITPIGELSLNDSPAALVNRLNLLIILGRNTNINLEKKMENLIRPILTLQYLSQLSENSFKKVSHSMLGGILSLANILRLKNVLFKGKILIAIFKNLVFKNPNMLLQPWTDFLAQFIPIIEGSPKSIPLFLKEFYVCFSLMSQKELFANNVLPILQLYLKNLHMLGASWVQENLLQIIKGKIHLSTNWIDYYCTIGNFLIQEDAFSWWSFYMYNDLTDSLMNKFYFYCKILQLCDSQSFELIKRTMFETATKYILHNDSTWFRRFLVILLDREHIIISEHPSGKLPSGTLYVVKKFLLTLSRLSYNDLLLKFISDLQKYYQEGIIDRELIFQLVEYLNLNFVDYVKSSHDFFLLKRELGISDIETEKSTFRDVFKSHKQPIPQSCFIESGIIHACSTGTQEVSNYMQKLKSLFNSSTLPNFFRFFVNLIAAHLQSESKELLTFKLQIGGFILYLINDFLKSKYLQVKPDEFLELCKLHILLCSYDNATIEQERKQHFRKENIQFQINVLRIADGFSDYHLLAQRSKEFLIGNNRPNSPPDDELSAKVDEITRHFINVDLHVELLQPHEDLYTLMSQLHDMVKNA